MDKNDDIHSYNYDVQKYNRNCWQIHGMKGINHFETR